MTAPLVPGTPPRTFTRRVLARRIARFVDDALEGRVPEPFDELALDIHRWQVPRDPVLGALVEGPVSRWSEIPAVPVALFAQLPVGACPRDEATVVFRTSGTTTGLRGEHHLRSTALYDRGAARWARRCVPGMPERVTALLADPAVAPDSSLSHMCTLFGPATWHVRDGLLDADGLERALREGGPRFVPTTAFALAEWLDHRPGPLPAGSVLMITGGFKGRVHALDAGGLVEMAREVLRPARVVTEYGMTELSSQLWGTPELPYLRPPWLEVVAVDPASGDPVPAGERGQLRFYDLCNLDGTLAVETMDEGRVHRDGTVEWLARLGGAPPRGCSLTVEEAWRRRTGPSPWGSA